MTGDRLSERAGVTERGSSMANDHFSIPNYRFAAGAGVTPVPRSPLPLSHPPSAVDLLRRTGRMGEGGKYGVGATQGGARSSLCPGPAFASLRRRRLVCVTLSGFLGGERWRRFGVNGRVSRGKKVSVSILWLGLGRHGNPPGCAGTTPVDRGITKRRCGVRAGSRCASTPGYHLSSLRDEPEGGRGRTLMAY